MSSRAGDGIPIAERSEIPGRSSHRIEITNDSGLPASNVNNLLSIPKLSSVSRVVYDVESIRTCIIGSKLTIAWWNTALSPTKNKDRAKHEELAAAAAVVRALVDVVKADFIALGEVSENDMTSLQSAIPDALLEFNVLPVQEKAGRSQFDTSLIYRKTLQVTQREAIVRWRLRRATRVAQRFDIELPDGSVMHIYVSHWPSRGTLGAFDPERLMLGNLLRSAIDIGREDVPSIPVILLGDFNDEPFDPAMDNALLSSRDRLLVNKAPELLYNPFWRHMTSYKHAADEHQFSDKGTYFHAQGQTTKWRTFDQMLFSSSLVNGTAGWTLDEAQTRVFEMPQLEKLIEDRTNVFDHMPIVGRLLKE